MFAQVVFPLPFRNAFTYSVPKEMAAMLQIGVRVVVPFGKRTLTGFVVGTSDTNEAEEKTKPLFDILDETSVFNRTDLKFYEWLADYYLCSLGEALKLAVPYGLEVESKRKIIADTNICSALYLKEKDKASIKGKILKTLLDKEEISISTLQKVIKKKNIYSALQSLEREGALNVLTLLSEAKVRIKTANFVKLSKPLADVYECIPEIENRSPKQVAILLELISKKNKPESLAQLLKKTDTTKSSVDSLVKKGLVEIFEKEIERKYKDEYQEQLQNFELTDKQKSVITEVSGSIEKEEFQTYLLHGVTGSGKTQVYIELVKNVLSLNKTALILVPEISLTPQITSRLYNNFGDSVTVLHSRMSMGERYDSWRRILNKKSKVVVGARSALFAPLNRLGLIVVDEEHDASYKQTDMIPKYNARDAAIVLGKIKNCPVLLGSATPSIESMYNALSGKFKLLTLPDRVDNAKLPKIELVNVIIERKKKKMENVFSKTLLNKIEDRLKKKEGTIILQNRRGFSTQIYCNDCGEIEICTNCSVPMVYHINKNILQCHYCGFIKDVPKVCFNCGSHSVKYFGTGTERVEDELSYYFPNAKVKRVDSDTVSRKSSLGKMLLEFGRGEIDILVGTQMVSKGLDFSRVTLVGVISAETSLWIPDFRADERTFQMLTQVAGRAGRSQIEGEVIIQTQNEKRFALQKVLLGDYEGFYQKEIADREKMGYPPFTRICLIETKDEDDQKAKGAIMDFYKELLVYKKYLNISPPSPAIISKLKGSYRYHMLIKSSKDNDPGGKILQKALFGAFAEFNRKSRYRNVKLFFDVDPQSVV
ncbi:MAG: primosomal protein N' [Ignavibacteriaceae bacterium]|nr:primosomal protein N' [Ignavibacteriaceae bacterium]